MKLREQMSHRLDLVVGFGAALTVIALFFFDREGLLLYIRDMAGHMRPGNLLP